MTGKYAGVFVKKYSGLRGKDWIRRLSPEDFRVFVWMGLEAAEHGRLGGYARAKTALRDKKGRFAKNGKTDEETTAEDGMGISPESV